MTAPLYKSPLDRAAGWEVHWQQAAPLFEAMRGVEDACFVYFIGEEDGGYVKIGSAKDPIGRLRGLQTGNPRRLQVEHVLLGHATLERLLHELWEPFAVRTKRGQKVDAAPGTEWFRPEVREELWPILKAAAEGQIELVENLTDHLYPADLERIVREAHTTHGFVAKGRDEVRLLAAGLGSVVLRRSRI